MELFRLQKKKEELNHLHNVYRVPYCANLHFAMLSEATYDYKCGKRIFVTLYFTTTTTTPNVYIINVGLFSHCHFKLSLSHI